MKRENREINSEILRLAVPAVVSNVTIPLLGLSDTAISGHLGSASFIAAIAVASMMLNVAFWLFGFLRMGTTGLVAEAFGARDRLRSRRLLLTSVGVGLLFGVLFIILRAPLADLLLGIMAPDDNVDSLAREYFDLCIFGAPALLATMSVNGWFVGMQSTVRAMAVSIVTNVVNILLSVWFVFGLDMGFIGVGYGTLLAQWLGLFIAVLIALPFYRKFSKEMEAGGLSISVETSESVPLSAARPIPGFLSDLKRFFGVNINLFFRSACVMAVSMTVTSVGSRLGDLTLATNAVMMQFFVFFSYFMDGFAFAGEAMVGRAKGGRDSELYRIAVRWLLVWSGAMGVIFFVGYAFSATGIASLMTDNHEVVENVARYRIWLMMIPLLTVMAFIFDGFFIGLTRTRAMLFVTLAATVTFFAVAFIPFGALSDSVSRLPDNNRLWGAFLTYLFLRGILLAFALPRRLPD